MTTKVDTVIVGGRVAGASLGARLARAGQRVIVLEADELGSDQVFSTHALHPPAVQQLRELGVLEAVLEHTPWVKAIRIQIEDAALSPALDAPSFMLAPRRHLLDGELQKAAARAGADVRGQCRVTDVTVEQGRATGVRYRTPAGALESVYASVVIGADGRRSLVAAQVGAESYAELTSRRVGHWAYFSAPKVVRDGQFRYGFQIAFHGNGVAFMFHTGHDEIVLGSQFAPDAPEFRAAPLDALFSVFRRHENSAPLIEGVEARSKIRTLTRLDFFFRRAVGPGWALVGDAGLHKDPTPGFGITDALRDSEALSRALLRGGDRALHAYWIERDRASIPLYHMAEDMGDPGYANAFNQMVFRRVQQNPKLAARMLGVFSRTVEPGGVLGPARILSYCTREMLRGNVAVWPGFLRALKSGRAMQRDLDEVAQRASI